MADIQMSKVFNARVYIDDTDFIAKASEVDLPKIKFKYADTKALGLYAESELPTGLDKMESRFMFNSIYGDFLAIASEPFKAHKVIVRGTMQSWTTDGVSSEVPVKAELKGFFKEFDAGKIKGREGSEAEATMNVIYFKLEVDNKEIIEIDTINNIYKVKGVDRLKDYKANLGG